MAARRDVLLKIVITGDALVGKTSVINKLVRDTFEPTYQPTTGANHDNKSFEIDGQLVTLQLWDNEAEGVAFYKGADAFCLVYDVADESTFESMDEWMEQIEEYNDCKLQPFPLLVLGNKVDRRRSVSRNDALEWCSKRGQNVLFYEISCKKDSKQMNCKQIIDNAFIELSRMCILEHSVSISEKEGTATGREYVHRIDPLQKRKNETPSGTICGGPATQPAFCSIL